MENGYFMLNYQPSIWSGKCSKVDVLYDSWRNRKTQVFHSKTRVRTGTQVLKKIGFYSIPTWEQ